MDSLDEKQKAFEERIKNHLAEEEKLKAYGEKAAKEAEKKMSTLTQPIDRSVPMPEVDAKFNVLPDYVAMKGRTLAAHFTMLDNLINRYQAEASTSIATRMPPGEFFLKKKIYKKVCQELAIVFQNVVNQMNEDNQEISKKGLSLQRPAIPRSNENMKQ